MPTTYTQSRSFPQTYLSGSPKFTLGTESQKQARRDFYTGQPGRWTGTPFVFDQLLGKIDPTTGLPPVSAPTMPKVPTTGTGLGQSPTGKPDDFPNLAVTVEQPGVYNLAEQRLKELPGQTQTNLTAWDKIVAAQAPNLKRLSDTAEAAYNPEPTIAEARGLNKELRTTTGERSEERLRADKAYEAAQQATQAGKSSELDKLAATTRELANFNTNQAQKFLSGRDIQSTQAGGTSGLGGAGIYRRLDVENRYRLPAEQEITRQRIALLGEQTGLTREYHGNDQARMQFNQAAAELFRNNETASLQYFDELRRRLRAARTEEERNQIVGQEYENLLRRIQIQQGETPELARLAAAERSAADYSYQTPFDSSRIPPSVGYAPGEPVSGGRRYGSPLVDERAQPVLPTGKPDWYRYLTPQEQAIYDREPWRPAPTDIWNRQRGITARQGGGFLTGTPSFEGGRWIGPGGNQANADFATINAPGVPFYDVGYGPQL